MTLPVSAPISLGDVLTEIRRVDPGRALPISLGDADVRALAGKPSGAVSLSDLYGKSSYTPMQITASGDIFTAFVSNTSYTASAYPSVSVANGDPVYAYLWELLSTSSGGFVLSEATSSACTVSRAVPANSSYIGEATLRCRVTDSTNHVVFSDVVTAAFYIEQPT